MSETRRAFLAAGGTLLASGLGGCLSSGDGREPTPTSTERQTSSTTAVQNTPRGPYERTHAAENLDAVVSDLDAESIPLSFVPADEDADYADSNIFDEYNNQGPDVLSVEIDLAQSFQQRHYEMVNWGKDTEPITEFIQGVTTEDDEWVDSLYSRYLEKAGGEDLMGIQEEIEGLSWETYKDQSLSLDQRLTESGIQDLWYLNEMVGYGSISSTNNQYKAHALQGAEKNAGFDTFIWEFRIPSHGLVPAIENPTRSEDETGQQEAYIIETDPNRDKQIATVQNSPHKAREPFNGENEYNSKEGLYEFTAIESREEEVVPKIHPSSKVQSEFVEFFYNPESEPAYEHLDPMNAAAYVADKNIVNGELEGRVDLDTDAITIRS